MRLRNDLMPFWTGVNAKMLTRAPKLVAAVTWFPVQYNKAIVGRNAFAHESGIHQDGMLKHTQTYEIMVPEDVGVKQTSLVMGKHSGRHAFVHKLEELGYRLGNNQLEEAFVRFKALADYERAARTHSKSRPRAHMRVRKVLRATLRSQAPGLIPVPPHLWHLTILCPFFSRPFLRNFCTASSFPALFWARRPPNSIARTYDVAAPPPTFNRADRAALMHSDGTWL
jgi:hypothetical protein